MPLVWLAPASMWAQEGLGQDEGDSCCCSRPCCEERCQQRHAAPTDSRLTMQQQHHHHHHQLHGALHHLPGPPPPEHDPELAGRTVLVVLPGGPGRRRLLRSMGAAGARVLCYATGCCPVLAAYVDPQGWILGPADSAAGALSAIQAWLQAPPLPSENLPRRIDALVCYNEFGLELYVQLAEALHLAPGTTLTRWIVEAARSKRIFRRACVAAGLPAPRFVHLTAPATPEHPEQLAALAAAGVSLPAVVKPSGCAGSFSVLRVNTTQELQEATQGFWQRLPAYLQSSKMGEQSLAATDGVLVEELIQGHEVDIDCVVYQGQLLFASVSDNHPCSAAFIETGGRCPSSLPDVAQEQLLELTANVIGLFGAEMSGVLHFEAMYDPARHLAVPIELNARIGGGETYVNVQSAWGLDLAQAALRIACGLRPRLPEHLRRYSDQRASLFKPITVTASVAMEKRPVVLAGKALGGEVQLQKASRSSLHSWLYASPDLAQGNAQAHVQARCGSECSSCDECRAGWGSATSPGGLPWALWAWRDAAAGKTQRSSASPVTVFSGHGTDGSKWPAKAWHASHSSHSSSSEWSEGEDASAGSTAATAPQHWLRHALPLRCVHSVNFVPDWSGAGVLERLSIASAALGDPSYVDAELYLGPGDEVQMPPAGFSALGWMVAQAAGPEEAAQAMDRLLRDVTIDIRPPVSEAASMPANI